MSVTQQTEDAYQRRHTDRLRNSSSLGGAFVPGRTGYDLELATFPGWEKELQKVNKFHLTHTAEGHRMRHLTENDVKGLPF